jgi:outer membrane protein insertion porin family
MVTVVVLIWRSVRLRTGTQPLVALYLLFSAQLIADPAQYEGQKIVAIRFDPDTQPLLPDELARKLKPLESGATLQLADVRTAIGQLFESGRYTNIIVEGESEPGGVALLFRTELAQFVRGVVVEGVPDPPNQGQLVNATNLHLGTEFHDSQIQQATESLLEVLRSNGFYLAKVNSEKITIPEAQQVDVRFLIEPGGRAKFDRPVLKGNLVWPEEKIINATGWKRFSGLLGWKTVTESKVGQGIDRIRNFYQKRDHLMAKVGLDQMEYRRKENRAIPQITIDAGPKVIIQAKGADVSRGRLRQLVPVFQEQTVDRDLLVEGQRNLTDYFHTRGYFDAVVDFDMMANARKEQVIEFAIYPGDRHKLIKLDISGNEYFDDETLRERMYIMPATLLRFRRGRYSLQYLRRDVEAIEDLYRSNGFRDVEVT